MNRKEQWIDDTLNTLEGVGQAILSETATKKILAATTRQPDIQRRLETSFIWKIAATLLILVTLNIMTGILTKSASNGSETTEAASSGYLDYLTPIEF
jgi:hypothetical protein